MKFIIADNYENMSARAADCIVKVMQQKADSTLGLATGTTPIGLYGQLVALQKKGALSFADTDTYNLDEYRGIDGTHEQSYRHFMNTYLFDHVDIDKARTHVPDGSNDDADAVCSAYDKAIHDAGGVDIQLLGLGHNGHIGFNEPDDSFPVGTHLVNLTPTTIQANSRLFDSIDDVPTQAYTMGIGTIMSARKILVVVSGNDKAAIVRDAFFGPVLPQVPASILQFHPDVTVVLDADAASLIPETATD